MPYKSSEDPLTPPPLTPWTLYLTCELPHNSSKRTPLAPWDPLDVCLDPLGLPRQLPWPLGSPRRPLDVPLDPPTNQTVHFISRTFLGQLSLLPFPNLCCRYKFDLDFIPSDWDSDPSTRFITQICRIKQMIISFLPLSLSSVQEWLHQSEYSVKNRFKYTALVWSNTCFIWVNFATNALFRPINVKKYTDLIKIHQRRFWWCWLIWQMITQQALQHSTKSDPACPTTWKRRWGDKVWKEKIAEHVGTTIPHMVAISVQIVRIGEWMLLVH